MGKQGSARDRNGSSLEKIEIGREVTFETSRLALALLTLRDSDALMSAPDCVFEDPAFAVLVTALPVGHIPLFDQLRIDLCLVQHEGTMHSPLHRWVASEAVRALADPAAAVATPTGSRRLRILKSAGQGSSDSTPRELDAQPAGTHPPPWAGSSPSVEACRASDHRFAIPRAL